MFCNFVFLNIACYDGVLSIMYKNPFIDDESHLRKILIYCLNECDSKMEFTMQKVESFLIAWHDEGEVSAPDTINILDII